MALVKKLENIQRNLGLTDADMARKLRVSRSTWYGTRTGVIPLGESVRKGAVRLRGEHPDLEEAVLASLADSD